MIYQDPNPDEPTHPLIFRLPETGPELLRTVLLDLGWKEYSFETPYYNLYFKPSRFTLTEYNSIQPYQRLNHFKNSTCLTKKDSLFRLLKKFQGIYGSVYEFFPKTLNLPNEYCKFVKEFTGNDGNRGARGVEGSENFWICKPVDKSRGRGIVVFNRIEKLQYDQSCVVQKYIERPLLVAGFKFDLRCYVVVTSFQPLTIYLSECGLSRFSTLPYTLSTLRPNTPTSSYSSFTEKSKYTHLTNTSINLTSPYLENLKSVLGSPNCKCDFPKLAEILSTTTSPTKQSAPTQNPNHRWEKIWKKIKGVIIKTLLIGIDPITSPSPSQQFQTSKKKPLNMGQNCFELFGFDILLDEGDRPWLLEVNQSPALSVDCEVDLVVKERVLRDMVALSGLTLKDAECGYLDVIEKSTVETGKYQNRVADVEKVGSFSRIFPFNAVTARTALDLKVGSANMKLTIQEIQKKYN